MQTEKKDQSVSILWQSQSSIKKQIVFQSEQRLVEKKHDSSKKKKKKMNDYSSVRYNKKDIPFTVILW